MKSFFFNNTELRSTHFNNQTYLVAKDVCLAIGYNKTTYRNALENHVPSKYKIRYEDLTNKGLSKCISICCLVKLVLQHATYRITCVLKLHVSLPVSPVNLYISNSLVRVVTSSLYHLSNMQDTFTCITSEMMFKKKICKKKKKKCDREK